MAAISQQTVFEVHPSTGSDLNGLGYATAGNTFAVTDLTGVSGCNTATPVVSSSTYSFLSGDVGTSLYIATGTNWVPGLYVIASVNTGVSPHTATLSIACATTATPTGGSAAIDRSQVDAAFVTIDNGTVTTTITGAVVTFVTGYTPTAMDPGNLVNFAAGTNVIAGVYQIISVSVGGLTWTLSATPLSSGTTTNATAKMGGAGATISKLTTTGYAALANDIWVKAQALIPVTTGIAFGSSFNISTTTYAGLPTRLLGYTATRGDGGKVTLQATTGVQILSLAQGMLVQNFIVDGASHGGSGGISCQNTGNAWIWKCIVKNSTTGITGGGSIAVEGCEVTNCGGTAQIYLSGGNCSVIDNWVHDSGVTGIQVAANSLIFANFVTNNSGASNGVTINKNCYVLFNTFYNNGAADIYSADTSQGTSRVVGNITDTAPNGLIGASSAGFPFSLAFDGNAFHGHTTNFVNLGDTTVNTKNLVGRYTNGLDVIFGSSPFNAAGSNDFGLNSAAGAVLRGAAPFSSWTSAVMSSYRDFGAAQHQEVASATRLIDGGLVK